MHITFQHFTPQNGDKVTTSYQDTQMLKAKQAKGHTVEITETVMDDMSYQVPVKTFEDVMQNAKSQDVLLQRDYMTVMSNSMSDEEFAKMVKEGGSLMDMELEEVVTIIDKIKSELLKSGKQIVGYTDNIDLETLSEITGSETMAKELAQAFSRQGITATEGNMEDAKKTLDQALKIEQISDGVIKYMVENHLEPTVENLFKAQYSSLPKVPSTSFSKTDIEKLSTQIANLIKDAGYTDTEESLKDAIWLLEKGILLTKDTLKEYKQLKEISYPLSQEKICHAIASAFAEGKPAKEANLFDERSIYEKAADIESIMTKVAESDIGAKRQAEEIRLLMTTKANLKLLRSDFYIDTKEIEVYVETLKQLEQKQAEKLFGQENPLPKYELYKQTNVERNAIAAMPLSVVGTVLKQFPLQTIQSVYEKAENTLAQYKTANKSYETFMTVPRADLKDRISKAFQNTDVLLEELNLTVNEENRRAIRILGYNSMELNGENIEEVKNVDKTLRKIINKMTPAAVLKMIREGVNPLETSLEDLEQYFNKQKTTYQEDVEKYSRYLYKLEKNHEITESEKEAYIGIYRLLHQIEKTDGAILGQLVKKGQDIEFKNLLSQIRTNKVKGMDILVDNDFGGLENLLEKGTSISEQISKGFSKDYIEILSDLSGTKGEKEYYSMQADYLRKAVTTEEETLQICQRFSLPITGYNLLAVSGMLGNKISPYENFNRYGKLVPFMKKEIFKLHEKLDSSNEAKEAYQEFTKNIQEKIEEYTFSEVEGTKDIRLLQLMHKQLSVAATMVKNEEYEMPVVIDGKITSLRLVLRHDSKKEGMVTVRMKTKQDEEISAQFMLNTKKVSGQIHYQIQDEEKVKKFENEFLSELKEKGFEADLLQPVSFPLHFANMQEKGEEKTETAQLYQLAKIFIHVIQNQ